MTKTKPKLSLIRGADLFCGAGGTSTGMLQAIRELRQDADLIAINHWDIAIATHSRNHEKVRHLCQNLDKVDPTELVPSGRLDILVASPECKHHSNARGGKPRSDQRRADAWLLMRWIEKLFVKNLLVENVREFIDWGPLGANGQPLKRQKGTYFYQFIKTLEINYHVEYKILNCADYGDPTTRERFFLMARRRSYPKFTWPKQTHISPKLLKAAATKQASLFHIPRSRLKPWVPAREIIDWNLPGQSIFGRKRPLSPNTLARIFAGLRKYSGLQFTMATGGPTGQQQPRGVDEPLRTVMPNSRMNVFEPFVMKISHSGANGEYVYPMDRPLSTITGQQEHAIVEPCLVNMKGKSNARSIDDPTFTQTGKPHQYLLQPVLLNMKGKDGRHRTVEDPTFTQCAGANHQGLIETDFLLNVRGGKDGYLRASGIDEPVPAITTQPPTALVESKITPFIAATNHGGGKNGSRRHHSIDEPFPTVTQIDAWSIIEPFLIQFFGERKGQKERTRGVDDPLWTVTGQRTPALIQPFLLKSYKGSDAASIDAPVPTITANFEHLGLVEPYLVKFNGTGKANSVDEPLDTITSKDRFGLVIPQLGAILDIRFRMLQPHELAAAMSFPKSYSFAGTREDKVAQIGNAVPCRTAKALCKALLSSTARKPKARTLRKAA